MNTESREKNRAMLGELAKLAQTMPVEREPDIGAEDSGVVHLASLRMTLAPPASHSPGGGGEAPQRAAGRWLAVAAVGVVAVVAGAAIVRRPARPMGPPPILLMPAGAPRLAPTEPAPVAAQSSDDGVVDPSSLPPATSASAPEPLPPVAHPTVTAKTAVPASVPAASVSPAAPAAQGTKSLGELMQEAVGAPLETTPVAASAAATAAEASGDGASVPVRPSLGAIRSAIGAVLPVAQGCLDADAPISHADIMFRSDGSVAAVALSGWAAGKPVEACVRRALSGARVPPFRQATYAVPATIRGN